MLFPKDQDLPGLYQGEAGRAPERGAVPSSGVV